MLAFLFFLIWRLNKCLSINAASIQSFHAMYLLRGFSIPKLCHFSVLIFLLMVLDLISSLPILMRSSIELAVQLEVYGLCLATRELGGILSMFL